MIKRIGLVLLVAVFLVGCGETNPNAEIKVIYPLTIEASATSVLVLLDNTNISPENEQTVVNFINKMPGKIVQGRKLGRIISSAKTGNANYYQVVFELKVGE